MPHENDFFVNDRIKIYDGATEKFVGYGLMSWGASSMMSGAFGMVGGMILNKSLEAAGFPTDSIGSLGDMIVERIDLAVAELKAFIREAFINDNLDDARSELCATIRTMQHYVVLPWPEPETEAQQTQRVALLTDMLTSVNRVIAAFQRAETQGGPEILGGQYGMDFAVAAGLHLTIVVEHIKYFGRFERFIAVSEIRDNFIPYLQQVKERWKVWSDSRFSVAGFSFPDIPGPFLGDVTLGGPHIPNGPNANDEPDPDRYWLAWRDESGSRFLDVTTTKIVDHEIVKEVNHEKVRQTINSEWEKIYNNYVAGLDVVLDDMRKVANKYDPAWVSRRTKAAGVAVNVILGN